MTTMKSLSVGLLVASIAASCSHAGAPAVPTAPSAQSTLAPTAQVKADAAGLAKNTFYVIASDATGFVEGALVEVSDGVNVTSGLTNDRGKVTLATDKNARTLGVTVSKTGFCTLRTTRTMHSDPRWNWFILFRGC